MAKIRALPEIKEWYRVASNPDLMINEPDADNKFYRVQVGLDNKDIFRTNYWLLTDPKTLKIYYWDLTAEYGHQTINLQKWRY